MIRPAAWPALVLAAGLGTRLRPLSAVRAKAALPVAGRPIVIRILEQLKAAGVERVVVNLHHRAETIARVVGDGRQLGLRRAVLVGERGPRLGGGPARALPLLAADRFFIVNGDTLAQVDLAALAAAHHASGALATLAVVPANLASYNAILADASGQWTGVAARGTPAADVRGTPWHFVGLQAVNAAAFASVDASRPSETVREIYPGLVAERPGAVRVLSDDRLVLRRRHAGRLFRAPSASSRRPSTGRWIAGPMCSPSHGTGRGLHPLGSRHGRRAGPAHPLHRRRRRADPAGVRYDRMVITRDAVVSV